MKTVTAILLAGWALFGAGARAEEPTPNEEIRIIRAVLEPIDALLKAASMEMAPVAVPSPATASEGVLQAFLVEPAKVGSIRVGEELRPCEDLRQEKRAMDKLLASLETFRRRIGADLTAYARSNGRNAPLRERLTKNISALEANAQILQAYFKGVNQAAPDRSYTYRLRLHGSRARSLEAHYIANPEVRLTRVRFAARRWMNFPTESYAVQEGLQGPPMLEADGVTWVLKRHLSAYQACTKNLAFALEFLTRWAPRPGSPAIIERGITVRTHAWVYDR